LPNAGEECRKTSRETDREIDRAQREHRDQIRCQGLARGSLDDDVRVYYTT
jgi:hypothetical protein